MWDINNLRRSNGGEVNVCRTDGSEDLKIVSRAVQRIAAALKSRELTFS